MPSLLDHLGLNVLFARSRDLLLLLEERTTTVLAANPSACELLQYECEDLVGRPLWRLFPESGRESGRANLKRFRAEDENPPHVEAPLLRKDGSSFPTDWFAWSIDYEGQTYLVAQFRDLSAQRRTIEEIRLRNVAIASVRSGVTIADARLPDFPLIYVNRGFEKITGYTADEAMGRSCRFLQGTDRDQPGLEILRKALAEGQPCEVRLRNQRKNGEEFWNELHISPVYDETHTLTHFVGILIDVTDRVISRLRLEESEERYRMLAESMEDLMVRTARDGKIEFLSPSCRRHLGGEPQEWIGSNFGDLVHPEDRQHFLAVLGQMAPEDPARHHSFRLRRSDGSELWMEATTSLISEHDREACLVSVIRDISLRKEAEEGIRKALDRERELNLIKTGFIRMVSHEFRTPMTGIGASNAFLSQYGEKIEPEKRQRHFRNIERSLARMNQLLDDVLFVSSSEIGRIPFVVEPVDVSAFCDQLIEELLAAYAHRQVDLKTTLPRGARFALDPNLLHHIMQNLLINALKYSPTGEAVLISVEHMVEEGWLRWTVTDHGIGIPPNDRERLFEPFQRAENVSTVSGTGLGLYIAKHSAELHGGRIEFQSTLGKGTQFTLFLPAHPATEPPDA